MRIQDLRFRLSATMFRVRIWGFCLKGLSLRELQFLVLVERSEKY